jgi:hypothetical protein
MMAGQAILVRVRGVRGSGAAHRGSAVAAFFAPGKDPERDPASRDPDRLAVLAFDPAARAYAAEVPTLGWVPGTWTVRGTVLGPDGTPEGWEYSRFPLDP